MSNLEVMERATSFTTGAYMNAYYNKVADGTMSYADLERKALDYSAKALINVLYSESGECKDYTRKDNLRYDMANIGDDGIKNELLKNVVNVAVYQISSGTKAVKEIGEIFREGLTDDQTSVILFNNIVNNGAEKGFELLSNSNILSSVCRSFANYRREGKREALDNISKNNNVAIQVNHELNVYYVRYGKDSNQFKDSYGGK